MDDIEKSRPDSHSSSSSSSSSSSTPDPPIFKHLNPKTQGLLRQSIKAREAQEQSAAMSASEQTYSLTPFPLAGAMQLNTYRRFIAIKPDGVQVGGLQPSMAACDRGCISEKLTVGIERTHRGHHLEIRKARVGLRASLFALR